MHAHTHVTFITFTRLSAFWVKPLCFDLGHDLVEEAVREEALGEDGHAGRHEHEVGHGVARLGAVCDYGWGSKWMGGKKK